MTKKLISAFLAAAAALSFSSSAFASASVESNSHEIDVNALMMIPAVNITWPTKAKIILNPYQMSVAPTSAEYSGSEYDTLISPELSVVNNGETEIRINVSGSVTPWTTVDANGRLLRDRNGNVTNSIATGSRAAVDQTNTDRLIKAVPKITVADDIIIHPGYDENGEYSAGETENKVLVYIEAFDKAYGYAGGYSKDNPNQILLGTDKVSDRALTVIEAGDTAKIKLGGDVATEPAVPWLEVADTDGIDIHLIFSASPVAPLPDKSS